MATQKQKRVYEKGGVPEEKKAAILLRERGFHKIEYHKKRHAGYWDIKCEKEGKKWLVEVKSDYGRGEPKIKISNIIKMINTSGIDKIGLLFIPTKSIPILFKFDKMSYAGLKAWRNKTGQYWSRKYGIRKHKKF